MVYISYKIEINRQTLKTFPCCKVFNNGLVIENLEKFDNNKSRHFIEP